MGKKDRKKRKPLPSYKRRKGRFNPRFIQVKVKGQPFSFTPSKIKYRDAKGKIVKFTTRKRLKVEVYAKVEAFDKKKGKMVTWEKRIDKYTTRLQKRKRPITLSQAQERIRKTLHREKKTFIQTEVNGLVRMTYVYAEKKRRKRKS